MINFRQFRQSMTHALRGVRVVFLSEQSFRLQIFFALVVIALGFRFRITAMEWIVLLLLLGMVLSLELVNSVFERIVDTFKPRIHPIVRDIKDLMAAAVLVMSVFAFFVGMIIFWPHLALLIL